jgi:putative DNA primase/helicase
VDDAFQTIGAIIDAAQPPSDPDVPSAKKKSTRRRSSTSRSQAHDNQASQRRGVDGQPCELAGPLEPLTDLGNAQRFVKRHGMDFRSCPVLGWLAWVVDRWSIDAAEGLLDQAVHEVVRAIKEEADDEQVFKWAHTSQGARHIGCISKLARPYLEISASALDADPFKFNVQNGTLIVRRDEGDYIMIKPHEPLDLISKIAPVAYDPAATCPVYDRFLEEVQPDAKVRRFLHQWGGLSLTGDTSEQKMVVFWGKGANGKSTLLETWAAVAGDYTKSIMIESFLDQGRARRGGEPTPDLAMLAGVRFLRTSEPERGAKLSEALIKLITGGDAMQVRHLNRDFFELRPQFKLTMSGNYRPEIRGSDEGIWRRVALVPWTVTIPPEKRDPHLGDKLRREGSGILNRLLDGLRDWLDNGLVLPDEVAAATAAYRSDSDPLGRFLAACVVMKVGGKVQSSVLYAAFVEWTKANGESEWKQAGFSRSMTERGYRKRQSDVMWWLDIEIARRSDYEPPP